jgi:membrane fusion protein
MSRLFRREAIDTQRQRLLGDAILTQPLSFLALTLFLVSAVILIGVLISLGSYARKETVSGFLSPDTGIVKIHAPRIGIVGRLHVTEGQVVQEDTPLLTLLGDRVTGAGIDVDDEMLRAIDAQLDEIEIRNSLEVRRHEADKERLAAELNGLKAERGAIDQQLSVQRKLLNSLQVNYERVRQIVDKGFISSDEYMAREENLLTNKQLLANLLQKKSVNLRQSRQIELAIEHAPLESDQRLSELTSTQADLLLQKTELQARRSINITAPIAGKVAALRAIAGASTGTELPLLTLLPDGGKLEAHLFVPTRAIGFVRIGQEVRLLYDAFDYRHFGIHVGEISRISSSAFSPAEIQAGIRISEPTYRVTVQISEQQVEAYGQQFSLQAGMLLSADIVLEKRSLINWIMEPLIRLRGRT